jgi:hypothetical protein
MMKLLPNNKSLRIAVIAIGILLVMTMLAVGAILILKAVNPVKDASLGTDAAKSAQDKLRMDAAGAEKKGDTAKAIETYKQLLAKYKEAGDTWGQADITAKITQLEGMKDTAKQLEEQEKINAKQRATDAGVSDPDAINYVD